MKKMLVMFAAAGLMLAACGKKNPPAEPMPPAADGSATAPAGEGDGSATTPAPEGDGSAAPAAEGGAEAPAGG